MPEFADVFHGYQAAGQAAIGIACWLFVASIVFGGGWSLMWLWRDRQIASARTRLDNREGIRAMAHERLARHEALPYTDDEPFAGDAGWPETNHQTHRGASS